MSKPKYVPTKKHLEIAWRWKKHGYTVEQICAKLHITVKQYELNRSTFNGYYKQSKILETHASHREKLVALKHIDDLPVEKGKFYRDGETKLDEKDIDLELLRAYVLCGYTREKIASLFGITRTTLYHYCNRFPGIKHVLENAKAEATAQVMGTLLKMTQDREVDDTAVASYLGDIYTQRIKKTVLANPNMVRYWLANNLGWGSEPRPEKSNNKGALIAMLDKLNGSSTEDNLTTDTGSQDEIFMMADDEDEEL